MGRITIGEAVASIKDALKADDSYAWSWQCNLAMPIYDGTFPKDRVETDEMRIKRHFDANEIAADIMRLFFDIDVRKSPHYPPNPASLVAQQAKPAREDAAPSDTQALANSENGDTLPPSIYPYPRFE